MLATYRCDFIPCSSLEAPSPDRPAHPGVSKINSLSVPRLRRCSTSSNRYAATVKGRYWRFPTQRSRAGGVVHLLLRHSFQHLRTTSGPGPSDRAAAPGRVSHRYELPAFEGGIELTADSLSASGRTRFAGLQVATSNAEEIRLGLDNQSTVDDALQALVAEKPDLVKLRFDAQGDVRSTIDLFVDGANTRGLSAAKLVLREEDALFSIAAPGGW